ncbi:MAG: DUF3078 domain-containing protein [Solitalea-like symbiont of Tyrophagus putrescentiae]
MKRYLLRLIIILSLMLIYSLKLYSQDYSIVMNKEDSNIKFGGKAAFKVSQAYFSKWSSGGQDLVSFIGNLILGSKYANNTAEWENTLNLVYGNQSLDHKGFRKTDDGYDFNSKYGFKTKDPRLLITLAFQFRSQFTKGYIYSDKDIPSLASAPFAPAYLIGYLGLSYKPNTGLSIFLSPFTARTTVVANNFLSLQGAYGITPGNIFLQSYGANLTISLDTEIFSNFQILSRLDLFSNYKKVSSVVVNWDNSLNFTINKLLVVSLSTGIIYDESIKWKETQSINGHDVVISNRPEVQYKQLLSVGILYSL